MLRLRLTVPLQLQSMYPAAWQVHVQEVVPSAVLKIVILHLWRLLKKHQVCTVCLKNKFSLGITQAQM